MSKNRLQMQKHSDQRDAHIAALQAANVELKQENGRLRRMLTGDKEVAYNAITTYESQRNEAYAEIERQREIIQGIMPRMSALPKTTSETRVGVTLMVEMEDGRIVSHPQAALLSEAPMAALERLNTQITTLLLRMPIETDITRNLETWGITKETLLMVTAGLTHAYHTDQARYSKLKQFLLNALWGDFKTSRKIKFSGEKDEKDQKADYKSNVSKIIKETFENMTERHKAAMVLNDGLQEVSQKLAKRSAAEEW